jgi:site-specific recombinase XerD
MSEWRLWQEAQGLSERTIAERIGTLESYFRHSGEQPLKMTPRGIMRFIAREELSATSRATYHASIRAYCAWLQRSGQRKKNPADQTPRPKRRKSRPRPIHDVQLLRLLAAANRQRTRTMILFGALAGLRVHEIAKLHGRDFDLEHNVLTVTGKGGKTAMIPLHPLLVEEAARWPAKGYWFPNYVDNVHGKAGTSHIRSHAVTKAVGDAMKRAGFEATAHQLRHWFGTSLLLNGVELRIVQELMRHESPATTAGYTEVVMSQLKSGIHELRMPVSIFPAEAGEISMPLAA